MTRHDIASKVVPDRSWVGRSGLRACVGGSVEYGFLMQREVPRTFKELSETMRGFVPFAICFAMLIKIWSAQFLWFRRYGLQNGLTIALNSLLLFVVLFYVCPLKFLFTYLVSALTGGGKMVHFPDGRTEHFVALGITTRGERVTIWRWMRVNGN
jgi:hypothetical protein